MGIRRYTSDHAAIKTWPEWVAPFSSLRPLVEGPSSLQVGCKIDDFNLRADVRGDKKSGSQDRDKPHRRVSVISFFRLCQDRMTLWMALESMFNESEDGKWWFSFGFSGRRGRAAR